MKLLDLRLASCQSIRMPTNSFLDANEVLFQWLRVGEKESRKHSGEGHIIADA